MKATIAGALSMCLFALLVSKGAALEAGPLAFAALPEIPVVVFGADQRASVEQFALARQLDPRDLKRRYAGTGLVRCGNAHGSGQLTLSDDVITTAAHVIYDHDGRLRGDSAHCNFIVEAEGQEIVTPLEVEGAITGSKDPYNESAVHDWAVIKLARPLRDAEPYPLSQPQSQAPVLFVARGSIDWFGGREMSLQSCALRNGLEDGVEGTREFAFDCSPRVRRRRPCTSATRPGTRCGPTPWPAASAGSPTPTTPPFPPPSATRCCGTSRPGCANASASTRSKWLTFSRRPGCPFLPTRRRREQPVADLFSQGFARTRSGSSANSRPTTIPAGWPPNGSGTSLPSASRWSNCVKRSPAGTSSRC